MNYKPSIFVTLAQLVLIAVMLPVAGLVFYDSFVTQRTAYAQEPKPEKTKALTLTAEQKLAVARAQLREYELAEQKKRLDEAMDKQLAEAHAATAQTVNALYAAAKCSPGVDCQLCDGPNPGPCAKAPAGDLTLQAIAPPAKEEKK